MKGLTIFNRSKKTTGTIKLRFRLRLGRGVDLYYKSDIEADLAHLAKFDESGQVKPKVKSYDVELKTAIDEVMDAIEKVFDELTESKPKEQIGNDEFTAAVDAILHPQVDTRKKTEMTMLDRFLKYADDAQQDGLIGVGRHRHYMVVYGILQRFLIISRRKRLLVSEFTADMIMELRRFMADEYKYVAKYPKLYEDIATNNVPDAVRGQNTISTKMKMLQAFYNDLMSRQEITVSPFLTLGRARKKIIMAEKFDPAVFLTYDELRKIMDTEVPATLAEVKELFLLQCAFGARINDFKNYSMDKVAVTDDGIPYIHYLPRKTLNTNVDREEIHTPIMLYALEIIKKWKFNFPLLKYVSGKSGYNYKIKKLLEYCGIDRPCQVFDEETQDNKFVPLYTLGCNKLCRKTAVDILNKAQVNMYAAGLHEKGSDAVRHYTYMGIRERFILMCYAYNQPMYKVDKDLNVIYEPQPEN